jgi:hypothetical protein
LFFFEPVENPGHIGGTFSGQAAQLTLGSAKLLIDTLQYVQLLAGQVKRLEYSLNMVAQGLGSHKDPAADRLF